MNNRIKTKAIDRTTQGKYKVRQMSLPYLTGLRERLRKELNELDGVIAVHKAKPFAVSRKGHGSIGENVANAIQLCGGTFTIQDVRNNLQSFQVSLRTPQIATVLARLNAQGKIRMAQPKMGNIAAIYQKNG